MYATFIGRRYGNLAWMLGRYMAWPFGHYVVEKVLILLALKLGYKISGLGLAAVRKHKRSKEVKG